MPARHQERERRNKRRRCYRRVVIVLSILAIVAFVAFICGFIPGMKPLDYDGKTDLTNAMLAVFTVVLAVVSYLQWDVVAEQNDAIEVQIEQMRLDQRPWVGLKGESNPIRASTVPYGRV